MTGTEFIIQLLEKRGVRWKITKEASGDSGPEYAIDMPILISVEEVKANRDLFVNDPIPKVFGLRLASKNEFELVIAVRYLTYARARFERLAREAIEKGLTLKTFETHVNDRTKLPVAIPYPPTQQWFAVYHRYSTKDHSIFYVCPEAFQNPPSLESFNGNGHFAWNIDLTGRG